MLSMGSRELLWSMMEGMDLFRAEVLILIGKLHWDIWQQNFEKEKEHSKVYMNFLDGSESWSYLDGRNTWPQGLFLPPAFCLLVARFQTFCPKEDVRQIQDPG